MYYNIVQKGGLNFVECLPGVQCLNSEQEALDLVATCGENETNRLLLHAENLSPDFFDLKSGLAGRILLKFSTYYLRVAAVLPTEVAMNGRFGEMVLETNRGNEFRVFQSREQAEDWLVQA